MKTLKHADNLDTENAEVNILNIFGKENLEDIQRKISNATGLAFVTVDYRGTPVTEMTAFSEFCLNVRKDGAEVCMSSDAFGAIQSAVTRKPFVYLCPCGLLEIAIPIIVRGQYLGGFIGGQCRCMDFPADIVNLGGVLNQSRNINKSDRLLFNKIPELNYQKFMDYADLISLIVNQMAEREINRFYNKSGEDEVFGQKTPQQKSESAKETDSTESQDPYFVLNCLNILANLAILEKSPQINEAVNLMNDFFKYQFSAYNKMGSINEEISAIENYLKIQKLRFKDKLDYYFNIDKNLGSIKIPMLSVLPFVERAVHYGIMRDKKGGTVKISVFSDEEYIYAEVFDNCFINYETSLSDYKIYSDVSEEDAIEKSIFTARQKLRYHYGDRYELSIKIKIGEGTKSLIKFPV